MRARPPHGLSWRTVAARLIDDGRLGEQDRPSSLNIHLHARCHTSRQHSFASLMQRSGGGGGKAGGGAGGGGGEEEQLLYLEREGIEEEDDPVFKAALTDLRNDIRRRRGSPQPTPAHRIRR